MFSKLFVNSPFFMLYKHQLGFPEMHQNKKLGTRRCKVAEYNVVK